MATRFPHAYVLNVMSDDHPGIVAAVSDAVEHLGGNIDACSQTVVSGYFTLIMVVSLPREAAADDLAARVRGNGGGHIQVMARQCSGTHEEDAAKPGVDRFVITAFGEDKPGIVRRVSTYLAGKDINIVDFYWHVTGGQFVMTSLIEIPSRWEISMLQGDLEEIGREVGFQVRLQHENVFVATNQLRLPKVRG